mmetsp:Transcript_17300/g.52626  ORF Transcript_17300/g.52626 Transcript_17300/m.52626 type:complete len:1817 (+) Transcript_17300:122-5572(+)
MLRDVTPFVEPAKYVIEGLAQGPFRVCDGDHTDELMLSLHGPRVSLQKLHNDQKRKTFEFTETEEVLQATLVAFSESRESTETWVAVLVDSHRLVLVSSDSNRVEITLSCQISCMWSATWSISRCRSCEKVTNRQWLVLQRGDIQNSEVLRKNSEDPLLSLSHALGSVKPIRSIESGNSSASRLTYNQALYPVTNHHEVLFNLSHCGSNWIVSFDGSSHSLWSMTVSQPRVMRDTSNVRETRERLSESSPYELAGSVWTDSCEIKRNLGIHIDGSACSDPELELRHKVCLARETTPPMPLRRVFQAVHCGVAHLLCLLLGSDLIALTSSNLTISFTIRTCIDASPVSPSSWAIDILTLRRDGLHLSRGDIPIARLDCATLEPHVGSANGFQREMLSPSSAGNNVVEKGALLHCVGSRVSISFDNSTFRASVVMKSADALTSDALNAMNNLVPAQVNFAICAATLELGRKCCNDWVAFSLVMKLMLCIHTSKEARFAICRYDRLLSENDFRNSGMFASASLQVAVEQIIFSALAYCGLDTRKPVVHIGTVAQCLHFLYEDAKLCTTSWGRISPLSAFLDELRDFWVRQGVKFQTFAHHQFNSDVMPRAFFPAADIHEWFSAAISSCTPFVAVQTLSEMLPVGDLLPGASTRLYAKLFSNISRAYQEGRTEGSLVLLLNIMKQEHVTQDDFLLAPPGLALPLHDIIHHCRSSLPGNLDCHAYELVGRTDLAFLVENQIACSKYSLRRCIGSKIVSHMKTLRKPRMCCAHNDVLRSSGHERAQSCSMNRTQYVAKLVESGCIISSCVHNSEAIAIGELSQHPTIGMNKSMLCVFKMLCSSNPVHLQVVRPPELSDHEFEQKKQRKLLQTCTRSCAAPFGRSILTFGSLPSVSDLIEPLLAPLMSLSGHIPQTNVLVTLDKSLRQPFEVWPPFHNGVATGLRLGYMQSSPLGSPEQKRSVCARGDLVGPDLQLVLPVTRSWISYNRPLMPLPEHGGLLLALGLQQQLAALAMTDIYEYLALGHDLTSIGILLGMAATVRKSAEVSVSKMLCLHVPSLLPRPFADMDVSSTVQVAAIAGVGLLFQATAHRLMTEFLLHELTRQIPRCRMRDGDSYSLTAGMSLGMVALGVAFSRKIVDFGGLSLARRLQSAMSICDSDNREFRNTGTYLLKHGHFPLRALSEARALFPKQNGATLNSTVAIPGATVAFGLYFMRTNSQAAARCLQLPHTCATLDTVRPDVLLLRVISSALVRWTKVCPTFYWVSAQVPEFILSGLIASPQQLPDVCVGVQSTKEAHANIVAGACMSLGLRYAGTTCEAAALTILHYLCHFRVLRESFCLRDEVDSFKSATSRSSGFSLSLNTNHLADAAEAAYIAAAATRVGVQYTMTAQKTNEYFPSKAAFPTTALVASYLRPNRSTLETCLVSVCVSLAMVMAGTGDLKSLRSLCRLRQRADDGTTYGIHMGIHMALGLLFLGGGRASLSRDMQSVAALLCAFFPKYPKEPDDNQYHLQPLRHFWVLAVTWRRLEAIDADSGQVVVAPLTITLRANVDWACHELTLLLLLPCMIPPVEDIATLSITSERYYSVALSPLKFEEHARALQQHQVLLKRRIICDSQASCIVPNVLSHVRSSVSVDDEQDNRNGVLPDPPRSASNNETFERRTDSVITEIVVSACRESSITQGSRQRAMNSPFLITDLCKDILKFCIYLDQPATFMTYIQVLHYAQNVYDSMCSLQAWSLRFILEYHDVGATLRWIVHNEEYTVALLRMDFVQFLRVCLEEDTRMMIASGYIAHQHASKIYRRSAIEKVFSIALLYEWFLPAV